MSLRKSLNFGTAVGCSWAWQVFVNLPDDEYMSSEVRSAAYTCRKIPPMAFSAFRDARYNVAVSTVL